MKSIESILNEIKASEALQKKLADAAKNNDYADFFKEIGWEGTPDEFVAAVKGTSGELADDELENVAGGANSIEAMFSVFSLGVMCAVIAIISADTSGVGNGKNGCILCNNLE